MKAIVKNRVFIAALITFFSILIVLFVILFSNDAMKRTDEKPGDLGTRRIVTLYHSAYLSDTDRLRELRAMEKEYEADIDFIFIDMRNHADQAKNLRLMANSAMTIYFISKTDDVISVWYDVTMDQKEFETVIEQVWGITKMK